MLCYMRRYFWLQSLGLLSWEQKMPTAPNFQATCFNLISSTPWRENGSGKHYVKSFFPLSPRKFIVMNKVCWKQCYRRYVWLPSRWQPSVWLTLLTLRLPAGSILLFYIFMVAYKLFCRTLQMVSLRMSGYRFVLMLHKSVYLVRSIHSANSV
jgi:hypothetical protein